MGESSWARREGYAEEGRECTGGMGEGQSHSIPGGISSERYGNDGVGKGEGGRDTSACIVQYLMYDGELDGEERKMRLKM
jgi:hypothetical protein